MSLFSRFDRHSRLAGRMAETLGVDIVDAAVKGSVSETVPRSAVYQCMACSDPEGCERWLGDHQAGADSTPDYCRNKALLERLSRA